MKFKIELSVYHIMKNVLLKWYFPQTTKLYNFENRYKETQQNIMNEVTIQFSGIPIGKIICLVIERNFRYAHYP